MSNRIDPATTPDLYRRRGAKARTGTYLNIFTVGGKDERCGCLLGVRFASDAELELGDTWSHNLYERAEAEGFTGQYCDGIVHGFDSVGFTKEELEDSLNTGGHRDYSEDFKQGSRDGHAAFAKLEEEGLVLGY